MIFWAILIIVAVITVTVALNGDGLGAFIVLIIGAMVGAMAVGIPASQVSVRDGATIQAETREVFSADYELVAVGSSDSISGRSYFLGGGYVEGRRAFNYAYVEDGVKQFDSAWAEGANVHEDGGKSVTYKKYATHVWWIAPFALGSAESWTFHVPAGSVADEIEFAVN